MAKQADNTPEGRVNIAAAIQNIATSDVGREALIDNSAVVSLVEMANQADNTPEVRSKIASAFQTISQSETCSINLIKNAIPSLVEMAKQDDNTSDTRSTLSSIMHNISKVKDGPKELIQNGAGEVLKKMLKEEPSSDKKADIVTNLTYLLRESVIYSGLIDQGIVEEIINIANNNSDDPKLRTAIAILIRESSAKKQARDKMIGKECVSLLIKMAENSTTQEEQVNIARAITTIAQTDNLRKQFIEKGAISKLENMVKQTSNKESKQLFKRVARKLKPMMEKKVLWQQIGEPVGNIVDDFNETFRNLADMINRRNPFNRGPRS